MGGKEKYFTKKLAHAKEVTVKTAGKGKEFAHKLSEKSNKREDVLYKKECKSKEMAFKAVREGKQKMKIVYVNKLPKKAKKAKKKATKHHKKVVKKHHKKVVKKVVHKVHPKVVVKKKTHKKKKLHVSSLKEVLIKTGEQSHKAQLKSQELMQKSNSEGKMAVVKEEIEKHHEKKSKHSTSGAVSKKEKKCKERDAKEDKAKSEIKTKLAVEKVKRENAGKESKSKIVKPKPAK